ncbi:MAG: peptidylprolyl isomerase [Bradymonadia bacterium]
MQIADGMVVTIEYTLKDDKGEVVESSQDRGAISFRMGDSRMLPGLAKAIHGMEVGQTREGKIPPGQLVPAEMTDTREVLLAEFPEGIDPKMGDRFQAKDLEGRPVMFEVFERSDEAVKVRLLHILHDVEVSYTVKVLAARKANIPPPPPVDGVPDFTDDLEEL